MVSHMKTTLNISDVTMDRLKKEAVRQKRTMSELVECALRMLLSKPESRQVLSPLPKFSSGGTRVNVANREALYEIMERH
jgi:Mn-dependent DtxR family transcriptional regulator